MVLIKKLSIFEDVLECGLIEISLGFIRKFSPMFRISLERVAEKNNVCLILGKSLLIFIISGIKPISSIRSASSIISIFKSFNITLPLSI